MVSVSPSSGHTNNHHNGNGNDGDDVGDVGACRQAVSQSVKTLGQKGMRGGSS